MAEPDRKSESLAAKIFRHAERTEVKTPLGTVLQGRGIVSALQRETAEFGDKRHALGNLSRPLYHFVGWLESAEELAGGGLTQNGKAFRILDAKETLLNGEMFCKRLLLEEKETDENENG